MIYYVIPVIKSTIVVWSLSLVSRPSTPQF